MGILAHVNADLIANLFFFNKSVGIRYFLLHAHWANNLHLDLQDW